MATKSIFSTPPIGNTPKKYHDTKRNFICFLSSKHPPLDKRVFNKEAVSLVLAGFKVLHLAPSKKKCPSARGIQVITYAPSNGLLGRILQVPRLYKLAAKIDANFYHCNELDSWFVGILLKILHHKKVTFDVHEHYPSILAERMLPLWLHPLATNMLRLIFYLFSLLTDCIVFAKHTVAADFKGSEKKQILVQNFTSLALENPVVAFLSNSIHRNSLTNITAIHTGLISRIRGWPEILEAFACSQSNNLHLNIIGTFNDGSQKDFEKQILNLGLSSRVLVEKWMPFEKAYQKILTSHIGLVLFQPGIQNHIFALPHKMFDYMLAGLPVIAPYFAKEVASIIKKTNCGILVNPSDPKQIADALDFLVNDDHERQRLGANGRRAVLNKYNWEAEAEKLINMYSRISEGAK